MQRTSLFIIHSSRVNKLGCVVISTISSGRRQVVKGIRDQTPLPSGLFISRRADFSPSRSFATLLLNSVDRRCCCILDEGIRRGPDSPGGRTRLDALGIRRKIKPTIDAGREQTQIERRLSLNIHETSAATSLHLGIIFQRLFSVEKKK